jgi:hypothetical protein
MGINFETKTQHEERMSKEEAYFESKGQSIPAELTVTKKEAIPGYNAVGPGRELIREATKKAQLIHSRKTEDIADEYNRLLSRMKELQDEKDRILDAPLTKDELLEIARDELPRKQREFKETFLREHFAGCQNRKQTPLSELNFRLDFGDNVHMLLYMLISLDDIEGAIASLPAIGTSKKEREAKVKKIEKEMIELSGQIDQEAEKLGLTISNETP